MPVVSSPATTTAPQRHPAVRRYLEELERAAKLQIGIHPQQVLLDADAHLREDIEALLRAEPSLDEEAVYTHCCETYGDPEQIVTSYADTISDQDNSKDHLAPGWRIYCTRCGRSAPAARVGVIRIGARSRGKRILGWCSECRRLRFLALTQDLHEATLLPLLDRSGDQQHAELHASRPMVRSRLVFAAGVFIALALIVVFAVAFGKMLTAAFGKSGLWQNTSQSSHVFPELPAGWRVLSETRVAPERLQPFSQKLGAPIRSLVNTSLEYSGAQLQINTVETTDNESAHKVRDALRAGKSNPRWVVQNANRVFEFVVRDTSQVALAAKARYVLAIQPTAAAYRVSFAAWPVSSESSAGAANKRNELFNLFLQLHSDPESAVLRSQIQQAVTEFQRADHLFLTGDLQRSISATWNIQQAGKNEDWLDGQLRRIESLGRPSQTGVALVDVAGRINIDSTIRRPSPPTSQLAACLDSTAAFPCGDPQIRRLAEEITSGAQSEREKLDRLLDWFTDPGNIRYDGLIGSRYGVRQVCSQRYGRCWDYSDLLISLCRSVDLPARQVYGWLYESEGHVWCDVAVDGEWIMVDPTTGTICGSDYLTFSVSETGDMSWVYASPVSISSGELRSTP